MKQMEVEELKEKMDRQDDFVLLDVRRPNELDICKIDPSINIEMNEIPSRIGELDQSKEYVVYCRSGQRSANVTHFLLQNGFEQVSNLAGGILAWSDRIDSSFKKY